MLLSHLLLQAFGLVIVGMLVVVSFLSLLILAMNLQAKFIAKIEHMGQLAESTRSFPENKEELSNTDDVSEDIVAAISSAIHQYRARHNK